MDLQVCWVELRQRATFTLGCCAGPIVMEEESYSTPSISTPRSAIENGASEHSGDSPNDPEHAGHRQIEEHAGACQAHAAAGICTGLQSECVLAAATGIRRDAQLRLRDCQVDSGRLTSAIVTADAEQNGNSRVIRRLMREVYGNPDQDYEDWQIVMLSDMEDGMSQ